MKDKFLCWFDGFPLQFGIVNELQKKCDSQFYAIIDVNKGREFYEKQTLIEFTKEWFYRDSIKNSTNFDKNYLSNFEKKYGINLWKIAYSDPILYKHNKFYQFNENEILSALEQECRFFELVLNEINPDFLILRITDSGNTQILHEMCKAKGIKILTLGFPRFGFRANISEELDTLDYETNLYEKKYDSKNWDELRNYLHGYAIQDKILKDNYRVSKKDKIKASLEFLKLILDPKYTDYYRNFGRNFFNSVFVELKSNIKIISRKRFVNKKLIRKINSDEKFVYFPLQLEPERTLLISAPYYTDQIELIEKIAKSIPIDFLLYVKEHPRQGSEGWRDIKNYNKVLNLPNVKFLHPEVSNDFLLENCSAVLTTNGTLGLEAIFNKKPTIVFAESIYSNISAVSVVTNLENLSEIIKKTKDKNIELEELNDFTKRIENNSFTFNIQELESKTHNIFYNGGYLFDVEIDENKVKKFLKDERELFEILANEHIQKIQQHKKMK